MDEDVLPRCGDVREVKPPNPDRVQARKETQIDVKQVRREFARLTQLFENFPVEWQKRVHEYVQVYKEALSAAGVPKTDTKRCAWEFQGALLQQLESSELQTVGPSHAVDLGAWVGRVLGSVSATGAPRAGPALCPGTGTARDAARAYVHSRLMGWAAAGAIWTKRWTGEWLPSEDALVTPAPSCAICLEVVRAPMRLCCGHEFCSKCVAKSIIAAFQNGRASGCPFRCAEWLSKTEVEALQHSAEDSIDVSTAQEYTSASSSSSDSAPPSPSYDSYPWASDDDYGTDASSASASPPKELPLNLEEIRGHLAVTRALVQRQSSDPQLSRVQHHVAALEVLLGVSGEDLRDGAA